jgi:tetratricopeptide (TPR) repeat protein
MKFLQVLSFYPVYIDALYRKNNVLSSLQFEDQVQEIFKDGFSGGHVIAPYLKSLGYESQFLVANNIFLQNQWFKENSFFPPDDKIHVKMYFFVKEYIESFQPDILYLTDPVLFNDSFINILNYKPSLILGWRSAPTDINISWKMFDVMLSNNSDCMSLAKNLGVKNVETFFPGFPSIVNSQLHNINLKYDLVFSGNYSSLHQTRNEYLNNIAKYSNNSQSFSYAYHILNLSSDIAIPSEIKKGCYKAKWGLDMFRALKEGKICFNAHIDYGNKKDGGNMRLFESTGVGAFSLVEWKPLNLDEYFESGKEIETFRSKDELIDKINYYLAHPVEREEIARRGQEKCLRDYSMDVKAKEFDQIIQKYFPDNCQQTRSIIHRNKKSIQRNQNLIEKAKQQLNDNNNTEALNLYDQAVQHDPDNYTIQYGRSIALSRLGRFEEAEQSLRNVLDMHPDDKTSQQILYEILSAKVMTIMTQAAELLQINKNDEAFKLLNIAKSFRQSVQGLDYLRGVYFLRINQTASAYEALKEELRFFPNNENAKKLFNEFVFPKSQSEYIQSKDDEFRLLFQAVRPYTMLSEQRLYSLYTHSKKICLGNIPGNFVECGVAAGGSSALIASVIKKYSKQHRKLYSFDSFEGMPEPSSEDILNNGTDAHQSGWGTGTCAASMEYVMNMWNQFDLQNMIIPVKGYFEQTLPRKKDEIGSIAFLHLDGDWYNSTKSILTNLYDNILPGGILQVDDYGHWAGCRKAIHEFESQNNVKFIKNNIDGTGIWFIKP